MKDELVIHEDYIIKISHCDYKKLEYVGFDILTENLVNVPMDKCFPITTSVLKLLNNSKSQLKNSKSQVLLAAAATSTSEEAASLLGITIRSWYRYMKEYCNIEEYA